ncbi:unnamed protein product, partial [marine sediment metagenome]
FQLWDGLLESFCDYTLKELRCKQQGNDCGFGMVDTGFWLFNLN